MQVILANRVHQAALAQWVILVHQVLHFQVKEEKRVSQVLSVRLERFFFKVVIMWLIHQIGIPGPQGVPGAKGEPGMKILS